MVVTKNNIIISFQWFGSLLWAVVGLPPMTIQNHSSANCGWWWRRPCPQIRIYFSFLLGIVMVVALMSISLGFAWLWSHILARNLPMMLVQVRKLICSPIIIKCSFIEKQLYRLNFSIIFVKLKTALIILCGCGLFVVLVTLRRDRQWDQGVHRDQHPL